MRFTIVKAQLSDLTEIEKIHLKYYAEIGQRAGDLNDYFNDQARLILVAKTDESEVVGYLTATIYDSQSFAEWIGVKIEGQKIGSSLVNYYLEECKKRGVKGVKLATRNRFKAALILYVKLGFEIFGVYQGNDGDLMLQLRKKL